MKDWIVLSGLVALSAACSGTPSVHSANASVGGSGENSTGGASATGAAQAGQGGDIGTWTEAPGSCPSGMTQVDITTESELESASRGEDGYASDPPSICYFLHAGTYIQNGSTLGMYVRKGGADALHRRVFVGERRSTVIVKSRATIDSGVSHVQLSNLTFDLTGYAQTGSFNTLSLLDGSTDLRSAQVTFTGDCATGANGGHIEIDGSTDVIVEDCLIEKFGRCGPSGHQDHGVYLANGSNLTLRNNEIRGNASRGIQFNTEGGDYGTLDSVVIERNRIHDNGHEDYEDGIVMNATGTGTISNVTVQNNLIYHNYYSGLRESGDVFQSIVIRNNTFFDNGAASSAAGRSELNLDDVGSGAASTVTRNIIVATSAILNNCYDAQPRGYSLIDNVSQGTVPIGVAGNCVSGSVSVDPAFVNATNSDFHPTSAAVNGYGAYAL